MAEKEFDYMSFFVTLIRKEKSEFEVSKEEQTRVYNEIVSCLTLRKRDAANEIP